METAASTDAARRRGDVAGHGAGAAEERVRRVGMLLTFAADDPAAQAVSASLVQGLQQLGWINGRNLQIDYRWGEGAGERYRELAAELVALAPDVIVANGAVAVGALQRAS